MMEVERGSVDVDGGRAGYVDGGISQLGSVDGGGGRSG